MHMGNALAHAVINSDKRPIGPQALFDGPFQQLRILEQESDQVSGKIRERLEMLLRHEEAVSGEKRSAIQESQGDVIFKNDSGGLILTADDLTERAGRADRRLASWRMWHASSPLQKE